MIMTKGIFETYTPAGTFLLPLSNCLYHYFPLHGDIAYFAYMVHHMDTILVVLLVVLNLTLYIKLPY